MTVCDRCQGGLEIGEGLDIVDLAGFDQRCDAAPCDAAFVMTGEERIFPIEGNGADQVFDAVVVDLDTPIGQEGLQPVPVIVDVIQLFTQPRLGGDLAAFSLEPIAEGRDQWSTAGLAGRQTLAGGDTTNVSFDGIDLGNAAQAFGGECLRLP